MEKIVSLPNDAVTVLGRASLRDQAIAFDWTNSGVYFRFRGSKLSFRFDTPALNQRLHVQIAIDGRWLRAAICGDDTTVEAQAAFEGEHLVHCVRINEVLDGVPLVMNDIVLEGEDAALLPAPPLPERRMMFIGDSITCGFGLLAPGLGGPFTTDEQDGAHTYAALTAAHFGAQAHFICISGRGIVRNCDNADFPRIPAFFEQTTVSDPTPWDHTAYQPQIIVVNAGTNDTAGEESPVDPAAFADGVKAFATRLRTAYPQAKLLWCYGMMATEMHDTIREALTSLDDENITYLPLRSVHDMPDEYGACYHPNQRAHRRCAGVLIDAVAAVTGWQK